MSAVVVVSALTNEPETVADERGPAGAVIDAASKNLRRRPARERYLPRGHLAIVIADVTFIRALMKDRRVVALSATDVDRLGLA